MSDVIKFNPKRKFKPQDTDKAQASDVAQCINWSSLDEVVIIGVDKEGYLNVVHNVSELEYLNQMTTDAMELLQHDDYEETSH